jgi:hypothetical protein
LPEAKLNIATDRLATDFHSLPHAKPTKTTEHIAATKVSLTINQITTSASQAISTTTSDSKLTADISDGTSRQNTNGPTQHGIRSIFQRSAAILSTDAATPHGTYQIHSH